MDEREEIYVADVNEQWKKDRLLKTSIRKGQLNACEKHLKNGANPNSKCTKDTPYNFDAWEPLELAVVVDNPAIMNLLIDHGARVDQPEVLWLAVNECRLECVAVLLEHGADPTDCLRWAVNTSNDHPDRFAIIELAFRAGGDHQGIKELDTLSRGAYSEFLQPLIREREADILKNEIAEALKDNLSPDECMGRDNLSSDECEQAPVRRRRAM